MSLDWTNPSDPYIYGDYWGNGTADNMGTTCVVTFGASAAGQDNYCGFTVEHDDTDSNGNACANNTASASFNVIVPEITSTTYNSAAGNPDDTRTTIGILENVGMHVEPTDTPSVNWTLTGTGVISDPNSLSPLYVAPSDNSTEILSIGDGNGVGYDEITFTVISPTGIDVTADGDPGLGTAGPPNNQIGAYSTFNVTVLPTTVAFGQANFREDISTQNVTYPSGRTVTYAARTPEFTTTPDNTTTDACASNLDPISSLYNGSAYVNFAFNISLDDEYSDGNGGWPAFYSNELHVVQYTGSSQQARTGIQATSSAYGQWQGPWR